MVVAIFGLGLIGGSLGRAILKKTPHKVIGYDIDTEAVFKAKLLKAIDEEATDENIKSADIVVFALNPSIAILEMEKWAAKLKDGAIITDCCGVKRGVVSKMNELLKAYPNLAFVGVHPMAGREFWGISHSSASLFEKAYFIVTPVHTPLDKLQNLKSLFLEIGCAGIEIASAEKHDKMIAYTSQLAHAVSASYIKNPLSSEHSGYSAGSFKDMTRVSKLNENMWAELFLENRDNLLWAIEDFEKKLNEIKMALKENDFERLKELLAESAKMKEIADRAAKEKENS